MASIAGTNILYASFRTAVAGSTAVFSYATALSSMGSNLFSGFLDNADTTPDDAHDFLSDVTTGFIPTYANKHALQSVTFGTASGGTVIGALDAADEVFTSTYAIPAGDPVESYIVYRSITNEAASPLFAHWGSATGLTGSLTPNGADVTVVFGSNGLWRF